jgi:hypothetical protein
MSDPDNVKREMDWLDSQVMDLERVADDALATEHPNHGAAVSARRTASELRKRAAQLRAWLQRQPTERRSKSPKQHRALMMLVSGQSTVEIALALDVDRRTLYRWRQDPEFDEQLRELQQASTDAVHAYLVASQLEVVRCLVAVATGPETQDMARVHACRVVLETLGKHKNAPVAAVERENEIESEEEVLQALADIPETILQQAIERRTAAKSAAGRRKKQREKDL